MDLFAAGADEDIEHLSEWVFCMEKRLFGNTGNESRKDCFMERTTENTVDRSRLKDIRDVVIDTSKPCKERIREFIEQIGDPYCYLDDGIVVEIGYADTQVSLQDRLVSYASSIEQDFGNMR